MRIKPPTNPGAPANRERKAYWKVGKKTLDPVKKKMNNPAKNQTRFHN